MIVVCVYSEGSELYATFPSEVRYATLSSYTSQLQCMVLTNIFRLLRIPHTHYCTIIYYLLQMSVAQACTAAKSLSQNLKRNACHLYQLNS